MEQNENTLSVLKIAPGQHPQQVEIDNNLKALQEAVGGTIAAVYPFADPVAGRGRFRIPDPGIGAEVRAAFSSAGSLSEAGQPSAGAAGA